MDFPIYQVPYLGNGMTIALDAVIHVLISHGVAIGMFAMIVAAEYAGYKKKRKDWDDLAKKILKPVVIIITGVGAVTGVGIWFTISVLAPKGTGTMLRIFFWPWFIEWMVFTAEVIGIVIYYFLWDKWTGKKKILHIKYGIGYVALACISGVIITGILGFMLTSDGWPWDQSFLSAFFNPSYFPQLVMRLSFAFFLGAVYTAAYVVFSSAEKELKKEYLHILGKTGLVTAVTWGISAFWYFSIVPSAFKTHAIFSVLTSHFSQYEVWFWTLNFIGVVMVFAGAASLFFRSLTATKAFVFPAIIFAILFVIEFERIREFIRGPYLIPGYMYANQVLLSEDPLLRQEGSLDHSYWYEEVNRDNDAWEKGAYLFGKHCTVCHTIGGLNDIKDRVRGRTREGIYVLIRNTQKMVPFMSPFSGTDEEKRIMAEFIHRLSTGDIELEAPSRYLKMEMTRREIDEQPE